MHKQAMSTNAQVLIDALQDAGSLEAALNAETGAQSASSAIMIVRADTHGHARPDLAWGLSLLNGIFQLCSPVKNSWFRARRPWALVKVKSTHRGASKQCESLSDPSHDMP